jgi:hypothetical protein
MALAASRKYCENSSPTLCMNNDEGMWKTRRHRGNGRPQPCRAAHCEMNSITFHSKSQIISPFPHYFAAWIQIEKLADPQNWAKDDWTAWVSFHALKNWGNSFPSCYLFSSHKCSRSWSFMPKKWSTKPAVIAVHRAAKFGMCLFNRSRNQLPIWA